jgi:hypothetical protein
MTPITIMRSEFAALEPRKQMKIARERELTIVDDPPPAPVILQDGDISRLDFDALCQSDRLAVIKSKQRIVDV